VQDESGSSVRQSQTPIIESSPAASISRDKPTILHAEDTRKHKNPESPKSPAVSSRTYATTKSNVASQEHQPPTAEISSAGPGLSDVLEKARAAIAAANRASAAARAAAELVKVRVTSQ
jgi:vacuolar protein sorting-associated protein IST1